ncbi:hypothetical protein OJAV_G00164220 [Oryzias javanicus]|uniref:VWFA domain-containing protein n=1 Tax=Oryzias javanicus TaxID=123683 RepID=A0A3S2LXG4_ORYJA|nr:hypothetical protein OJAV_G00164220 [Oryzias javanicus]
MSTHDRAPLTPELSTPGALCFCLQVRFFSSSPHCPGGSASPALPTELVFALDFSGDVSSSSFELQRSALLYLLEGVAVARGNCPAGARVSVVGFHERTTRLIRFHEHSQHQQLVAAVKDIPWKRTAFRRHLGAAMRFVGQSVFKRVRAGLRVRKVAVFFSGGQTQDVHEVAGAVMELRALNIVPVVVSLMDAPRIARALELDDSGNAVFTVLERQQDLASALGKVRSCAISFDPCRRSEDCAFVQDPPPPQQVDVDLAVVLDGSREVQADEFSGAQQLLGSVLEQLAVSAEPGRSGSQARVAVVQQGSAQAPKLEFGLRTFQDRDLMKRHLFQNMQQQGGPSLLGRTLDYTLREVLPTAERTRRKRVLLTVLATRTAYEDRGALSSASRRAHCDGVALFVLTVGGRYNQTQVEELASSPVQQHLIHVDRLGAEGRGYAQRFFRVFLSALSKGLNSYPPPSLSRTCRRLEDAEILGGFNVWARKDSGLDL